MTDALISLNKVILERKMNPQEKSYTSYLFREGLDKILKKVGEECAETIIAAKNSDNSHTAEEICDLIYHLLVLMANEGIELSSIGQILDERALKIGNLKPKTQSQKNS